VFAQTENSDLRSNKSVYFQIGGQQVIGVHVNGFISERFSLNGSLGILLDISIGSNYYIVKKENIGNHMYLGLRFAAIKEVVFGSLLSGNWIFGIHIPIGYELLSKSGFALQLEAGPNFSKDLGQRNTQPFLVTLKIGFTPKSW